MKKTSKSLGRIFSIVLCLSMLTSMGSVFAEDVGSDSEDIQTLCENYAVIFAAGMSEDVNPTYTVKETIKVTDINGIEMGYHISLNNGSANAGYIMVNPYSSDGFVSDYALEGEGLYESILNQGNVQSIREPHSLIKNIIKTNEFEYAVAIDDLNAKIFITEEGNTVDEQTLKQNANANLENKNNSLSTYSAGNAIFDEIQIGIQSSDRYAITGYNSFLLYTQNNILSSNRVYGCGPTAASNIIYYLYMGRNKSNILHNNSVYSTYDQLVTKMNCTTIDGSYATTAENANSGINNYISSKGYSSSSTDVSTWLQCKTQLNSNKPIYWRYNVDQYGHAVAAFGYVANTNGTNYLRVADGWNSYYRFFNISKNTGNGFAFNVS